LSWNKYGEDSFEFVVLEECFVEELDLRESYWIYFNRAKECGYNHRLDPSTNRGYVVSEEQKQRISGAIRSLWLDPVERVRLTKAKIGHVVTDEGRANMSKARCGSVLSAETKRRISESQVGRVASAETRLKMSKSSKRPAAKLTISQVKVIKCRLRRGETAYFIAKSLGLHPSTIYKIKDGANWRGVRV
jgi:group I intron endonuclease